MAKHGPNKRRRDASAEIHAKRSDTLVRTLRKVYGDDFLAGFRSDATLGAVLDETGADSLNELLKRRK